MKFFSLSARRAGNRRAGREGWRGVLFCKVIQMNENRLEANWLLPTPLTHVVACCEISSFAPDLDENGFESQINRSRDGKLCIIKKRQQKSCTTYEHGKL